MSKTISSNRVKIHIKEFINNNSHTNKMTQEQAAEALNISISSLKRCLNGAIPTESTAKEMERATGIIYSYWQGKTDCKTLKEYELEKRIVDKWDKEQIELKKIISEKEQRYKTLFSMCGYQYKYLTPGEVDFGTLTNSEYSDATDQHCISSFQHPDQRTYLSTEELELLISRLKETIDFVCYKKERDNL